MMVYFQYKSTSILITLYCVLFLLLIPGSAAAQGDESVEIQDQFDVTVLNLPSDSTNMGTARVLIFVRNDALRFLKADDTFFARYEISIDVFDNNDDVAGSRIWTQEIKYNSFDETISEAHYVLEYVDFILKPGSYKFMVQMTDTDLNTTNQKEDSKIIRSYWTNDVGLSDLVFAKGLILQSDSLLDQLFLMNNTVDIDYIEGFSLYVQIFSVDSQSVEFTWQISDFRNDSNVLQSETNIVTFLTGPVREVILNFTGKSFPSGSYIFRGDVQHPNGKKNEISHRMKINWVNIPKAFYNAEEALEQMSWILSEDNNSFIDSMTFEEKEEFFDLFWQKRDPTPNTERNELTEEYFKRVDHANENFSYMGTQGWKSDRGRIYCFYGQPDRGEDTSASNTFRTTDRSIPQIIWTYYKIRKIFIFADHDRSGNYVLISEEDLIRE